MVIVNKITKLSERMAQAICEFSDTSLKIKEMESGLAKYRAELDIITKNRDAVLTEYNTLKEELLKYIPGAFNKPDISNVPVNSNKWSI